MINWNYMVIFLSFILVIFLLGMEIKRRNRLRLVGRLIASTLAVAGLACLALPISIQKKINPATTGQEAVLLTEGYDKDSLETFIKKDWGNIRIYHPDSIPWIDKGLSALHIFGYGLSGQELNLINDIPLFFHPSPVSNGITAVHWRQKLNTGEKLSVQGTFANTRSWPVKITLDGSNTALDSVSVAAQKTEPFELSAFPKHIGKAAYSIIVSDKQGQLEKEPVPVEIVLVDSLSILLLAASPDFENKFLRNWLSEHRFAVASRTRISKNKYDKTFSDIPSFDFDKITNALLDRFDIVISDAAELAALTKTEQSVIHEQVEENGMGLIVKADSISVPSAFYAASFPQYAAPTNQKAPGVLYIKGGDKATSPLVGKEQAYIRHKPGGQPLVLDASSNILVSSSLEGAGKILFSVLNNTYTWMLGGNTNDYYSFWSCLLQKAAKRTGPQQEMRIAGALPQVNEPIEFHFETSNDTLAQPNINSGQLSLQQNPDLPFQWQGIYWPAQYGWQPVINLAGQQYEWYAYDKDNWKNISAIEKIQLTRQYIYDKNHTGKKTDQRQKYVGVHLSRLYFLVIFITCCSFLWLEKKFFPA